MRVRTTAALVRRAAAIGAASLAGACADAAPAVPAPAGEGSEAPRVIEGEPQEAATVARAAIAVTGAPKALATRGGKAVVGTDRAVLVAGETGNEVTELPVRAAGEEPEVAGAVRWMTARREGFLVVAEGGVFHDAGSALAMSPASRALTDRGVRAIDAFGEGEGEELWATSTEGLLHVRAGAVRAVDVGDAAVPVDVAVAAGTGAAVIAKGGRVLLVDLATRAVKVLAEGAGRGLDTARAEDGTVHVATERGLITRAPDGAVVRRTFAAAGAGGRAVTSVAARGDRVVAVVDGRVLDVAEERAFVLATDAAADGAPRSALLDGAGDLWFRGTGGVVRLSTGGVVSFARHVVPFLRRTCTSCHAGGADGAPRLALEDLAAVRGLSPVIVARLRAEGVSPMPPLRVGALTPDRYAVFIRWTEGGMQP